MAIQTIIWPEVFQKLEVQVVQGEHQEAKKVFKDLQLKQIPRSYLAVFAELAWRISEPIIALKLLNKIIFPENRFDAVATDKEKFIYATALGNLGAVREAIEIFNTINNLIEPEVLLRKSMVYFRDWNYTSSIPLLEEYLKQTDISSYRHLVGQVNLAAAFVNERRFDEVYNLLKIIQKTCIENNYLLLLGNSYELQGQVEFLRKNYDQADKLLQQAMQILKNQGGEFFLFAEKWKVINDLFKNNDSLSRQAFNEFRMKAKSLEQCETVRDCDLFESVLDKNEELFRKVILGTPSEHYRRRARVLFGKTINAQGNYDLKFNESSSQIEYFSFNPYMQQNEKPGLYSKPQLLALFEALMVDFYKPSYIGLLFQRIYKNEKFNPFTSPQRVLSLIKRLNKWFSNHHVPLQVRLKKSEFQIVATEFAAVKIRVQRTQSLSKQQGQLFSLKQHFKGRTFSCGAVSKKMDISKTSAQNIILQAIEKGFVKKIGTGRATSYLIVSKNKKRAAA